MTHLLVGMFISSNIFTLTACFWFLHSGRETLTSVQTISKLFQFAVWPLTPTKCRKLYSIHVLVLFICLVLCIVDDLRTPTSKYFLPVSLRYDSLLHIYLYTACILEILRGLEGAVEGDHMQEVAVRSWSLLLLGCPVLLLSRLSGKGSSTPTNCDNPHMSLWRSRAPINLTP